MTIYLFVFALQCNSPVIIDFYGAYFIENRISICTEYMDGMFFIFFITLTHFFNSLFHLIQYFCIDID